jgi:regulator of sigma E protease
MAKAGLLPGDRILTLNGSADHEPERPRGRADRRPGAAGAPRRPARRAGPRPDVLPARTPKLPIGEVEFTTGYHMAHPSPFEQIAQPFMRCSARSGRSSTPAPTSAFNKVSGPVGIVHIFHEAAEAGIMAVLRFTIFINVNLAILNLLPVPVLDGGQMVFATIGRLAGGRSRSTSS